MVIPSFVFTRAPDVYFCVGEFKNLGGHIRRFGEKVLIVTGSKSLSSSGRLDQIKKALKTVQVSASFVQTGGEPSPELVDDIVGTFRNSSIDVVCAIGGGSVIDAGKAVSAMLYKDESVLEYLEGVGSGKIHDGRKVPFIAVPTTSGTGSEATKNAVLSRIGPDGFKKSLRHDNFVPDIAVIDPELMIVCPPDITAASGLDAFTQLLESYVSTKSTPLTDALALSGLYSAAESLVPACTDMHKDVNVRAKMAYAALLSGVTLANVGLGVVHGIASEIGRLHDIPHGVICGTLVGAATNMTIKKLSIQKSHGESALRKYARVGTIFSKKDNLNTMQLCDLLEEKLEEWIETLHLPRLGEYGMKTSDIETVLDSIGNKNNPVPLDKNEIMTLITSRF
ncbi:iron-containing alcohol dehydrogenase [candidate division KSB1 bacterium]